MIIEGAKILKDLEGAAIVIAVLVAAAVIIKLIFKVFGSKRIEEEAQESAAPAVQTRAELKLIDVDEKTAALAMAIVSHESGIPLSELIFKSIKLV